MSEKLMPCDTRIEKFQPLYEVKPCPFCGADREYIVAEEYEHGAGKRWRVICLNCIGTMDKGYCQTQWQALDAWNYRSERTGKWIPISDGDMCECSECGECYDTEAEGVIAFSKCYHYCPSCGAKMDGEKNPLTCEGCKWEFNRSLGSADMCYNCNRMSKKDRYEPKGEQPCLK